MIVGFSGHIDIFETDAERIKQLLKEKLININNKTKIQTACVGIAKGADELFIEVCKELEITLQFLNETLIQLKAESDTDYYSRQTDFMVANCNQFIVVWDGVFTEKKGGTSWLVGSLIHHPEENIIHHLITPRKSNPYATSTLNAKGFQPAENDLDSKLPWLPNFHWASFIVGGKPKKESFHKKTIDTALNLWQSFLIPGVFALTTLLLGVIGYSTIYPDDLVNNMYRSINFISLNEFFFNEDNVLLEIARLTGLLTPISAIGFGLYSATYNVRRKQKLKNWTKKPKKFVVVLGENKEANDLVSDLNLRGFNVLQTVLNQEDDHLLQIKSNLLKKNFFNTIDVTFFKRTILNAGLIYLMDNDAMNLQQALKLESFLPHKNINSLQKVYVHINKQDNAQLLNNISKKLNEKVVIFNIKHNTIRRLLNYYPIDNDDLQTECVSINIIEFNDLAKSLCKHLLTQFHIEAHKQIELTIYTQKPENTEIEFYNHFKALTFKDNVNRIENYIWKNWKFSFLNYEKSLTFDQPILNKLTKNRQQNKITNFYFCAENSSESSSWLSSYLPRINQLNKETNQKIQFFCYYNNPDKSQEIKIERYLNKIAPNLLITCFGNHLEECSYKALNMDTLDDLAINISNWYDAKYNVANKNSWQLSSYIDKQSNRKAADHIWLKWRWFIRNSKTHFNSAKDSIEQFKNLDANLLNQLSEIEHRRWCANLSLSGYEVLPDKYAKDWKTNKQNFKSQYYHKDLVSFDALSKSDKAKDADQIQGISSFIANTYQNKK